MARQRTTRRAVVRDQLILVGANHVHVEAQQGPAPVDAHGARRRSMCAVASGAREPVLDVARVLRPACARVDIPQIVAFGA